MKNNTFSKPESALGDTQPSKPHTAEGLSDRVALEMLLHQARTAPDSDAALEYVQQAVDLLPDDPRVQASAQLRVFEKLNRDAFLAFLAETDKQYVIKFRNSRPFSVPKARGPQELYPPIKRNDGERALGMMWWLILGLIPAGLGAVILSPLRRRSRRRRPAAQLRGWPRAAHGVDRYPAGAYPRIPGPALHRVADHSFLPGIRMLTDLFYLAGVWLAVSLLLALFLGTHIHHTDPFTSMLYLGVVMAAGDAIVWWLGMPIIVIYEASLAMIVIGAVFIILFRDWNAPGQVFFLFSVAASAVYLFYAFLVTAFSPVSPIAFIISFLLFILEILALTLSLTYAYEVLDALCRTRWHRRPAVKLLGKYVPMVSLHVPAYNEPPELVEKTLRALANLDYPNYEVILVDNNTPQDETWLPLAVICQQLGFKCLHLDQWPGYKSGALNFALAMTDPRAEIIGVVDADYIVQPEFLRRLVPYFDDPQIAFVQSPQDYRDYQSSRFFQAAYDGYKYFFALSMPFRNERNAIIFCGTMGLLRKSVLQEIGGWDQWCITEDAEASLRILNRGYQSLFIQETFGRGLMPLDFEGLKKQRFRWAFGGVQIIKKHWGKLMPWAHWIDPANRLTGQAALHLSGRGPAVVQRASDVCLYSHGSG